MVALIPLHTIAVVCQSVILKHLTLSQQSLAKSHNIISDDQIRTNQSAAEVVQDCTLSLLVACLRFTVPKQAFTCHLIWHDTEPQALRLSHIQMLLGERARPSRTAMGVPHLRRSEHWTRAAGTAVPAAAGRTPAQRQRGAIRAPARRGRSAAMCCPRSAERTAAAAAAPA